MKCDINGVIIRRLTKHADSRGWLMELFRRDEMTPETHPVMSYLSMTTPGACRGPHEHADQTDCFCFLGYSSFRLYLWDNRRKSPTFGHKCQIAISAEDCLMVLVPSGVVHAYKNTGYGEGLVFNAPNRLYAGEGKGEPVDEIRYEDQSDSPFKLDG